MGLIQIEHKLGQVAYKERNDIKCWYAIVTSDSGKKEYYYLGEPDVECFSNGNCIASTALVEAIDPSVVCSHIGLLDRDGREVIPFENRTIQPLTDSILLVKLANPISESVIESNKMKGDPTLATKLVSTASTIKSKMYGKLGAEGRFLLNDQFSEATICDIDGHNLVNNEYYSFIAQRGDTLFLAKNVENCDVVEFSLSRENVKEEVLQPVEEEQTIDVTDIDVSGVVEEAFHSSEVFDTSEEKVEKSVIPEVVADDASKEVVPFNEMEEEDVPSREESIEAKGEEGNDEVIDSKPSDVEDVSEVIPEEVIEMEKALELGVETEKIDDFSDVKESMETPNNEVDAIEREEMEIVVPEGEDSLIDDMCQEVKSTSLESDATEKSIFSDLNLDSISNFNEPDVVELSSSSLLSDADDAADLINRLIQDNKRLEKEVSLSSEREKAKDEKIIHMEMVFSQLRTQFQQSEDKNRELEGKVIDLSSRVDSLQSLVDDRDKMIDAYKEGNKKLLNAVYAARSYYGTSEAEEEEHYQRVA